MTRLLEYGTWVSMSTGLVNIESPVGRCGRPWRSSWTKFEFACVQVEPVGIFLNKVSRKITGECGARNEL